MLQFLADTHALVWHLTEPRRLGKAARRCLASADQGRSLCHVSAISLVEIWLLYERGRLQIGPAQILEAMAGQAKQGTGSWRWTSSRRSSSDP